MLPEEVELRERLVVCTNDFWNICFLKVRSCNRTEGINQGTRKAAGSNGKGNQRKDHNSLEP
jgi:hypothetical protein